MSLFPATNQERPYEQLLHYVFSFSRGHFNSQEKLKTILNTQNLEWPTKSIMVCYGIFWVNSKSDQWLIFSRTRRNIHIIQTFNLLDKSVVCRIWRLDRRLSWRRSSDVLSVWSRRIERVKRSTLIQTNLSESDVELFMNLRHQAWFVSWTFLCLA